MRSLVSLGCALGTLVLSACGGGEGGDGDRDGRLSVVATTGQVADLVQNVGGDRVSVHRLLPAAADPHDYEPRPSDARALADADLVVRSGGDVDGWLGDLIDEAGGGRPVLDLSGRVMRRADDPHWWQDPRNAALAVRAIAGELRELDPRGGREYDARARAYTREVRRLDAGIARCIARVPPGRRRLVTTHDALRYYADRYGLEIAGAVIPSRSSQAQPSAGETDRLVREIRREGVQAIFPESALNPKLERAIAREAGVRVGRSLWADSLGPEGSDGATYLDAMAADTAAIVAGLSGGRESCRPRAG